MKISLRNKWLRGLKNAFHTCLHKSCIFLALSKQTKQFTIYKGYSTNDKCFKTEHQHHQPNYINFTYLIHSNRHVHCSCFWAHLWSVRTKNLHKLHDLLNPSLWKIAFPTSCILNTNTTKIGWRPLATVPQPLALFTEDITEYSSNARCWKHISYLPSMKRFWSFSTCSSHTIFSTCQMYCGLSSCEKIF